MMRWITRLAAIGLAAALIGFLWSRANSDFEDEDFDEEIPIEFDVPLESASAGAGAPAAINDADTGDGPGANLDRRRERREFRPVHRRGSGDRRRAGAGRPDAYPGYRSRVPEAPQRRRES